MSEADAGSGTLAATLPPAAPPAQPTGDMLSIPRASIPEQFGGDWHKAMAAAKAHQALEPYAEIVQQVREAGLGPDFLGYLLSGYTEGARSPHGAPQGLTVEDLDEWAQSKLMPKLQEQFGTVLSQRDEQYRQMMDRQRQMEQGAAARDKAIDAFLTEIKFPRLNEKGEPQFWGQMFYKEALDALMDVMEEGAPKDGEERTLYFAQPSEDHLKTAFEKLATLKNAPAELAAVIADQQQKQPNETLGEGPTARPQKPGWHDMTPEQQKETFIAQHPEMEQGED